MSIEVIKQIKEEREFLHDIANQMTIIQGMNSLILSDLEEHNFDKLKIINRMQKSNSSVNKMVELLKLRRSKIITEQNLLEGTNE
jgi:hypothetical protein